MIRKGSEVTWKWGTGWARGEVEETWDHEVTRSIKGAEITRKGEQGNKALLIRQDDGSQVLKLEQEVKKL